MLACPYCLFIKIISSESNRKRVVSNHIKHQLYKRYLHIAWMLEISSNLCSCDNIEISDSVIKWWLKIFTIQLCWFSIQFYNCWVLIIQKAVIGSKRLLRKHKCNPYIISWDKIKIKKIHWTGKNYWVMMKSQIVLIVCTVFLYDRSHPLCSMERTTFKLH